MKTKVTVDDGHGKQDQSQESEAKLVKSLEEGKAENDNVMKKYITSVYIILIILGIGTGFILSGKGFSGNKSSKSSTQINTAKIVGSTDTKTFKDSAVGTVEQGGIDGEGTHKLIRDGGPSQTVYLTSSVVDLDQFIGKKVTVWGQTMAAQKAGWLMDVGKVEQE
jgi:hypothetical protein